MPLHSYRCPDGHEVENLIFGEPPKVVECPVCGKRARKLVSRGTVIRYGKAGVPHVSDCKGIMSPVTGRVRKMDSFEYAKEMEAVNQTSCSTREWEKDQETRARRQRDDRKTALKRAKKKIMSTPGIFSEQNLQKKRRELNATKKA